MGVKRNRPVDFQSIYQCAPGAREGTIFLESDFAYFNAPEGIDAGVAEPGVRAFVNRGHQLGMGWDTAFEATSDADYSAGIVGLLLPCSQYHRNEDPSVYGPCEPHFDVLLMDLLYEKLTWADLPARFRLMHRKWEPAIHVIEKKASGIPLYQSMGAIGMNVQGVEANISKRARAVEGVGAGSVQGWFRQHRVLFPRIENYSPSWVKRARVQLKDFTGAKDASDDIVDAIVHLVTYAIRLGNNTAILPSDWTPERDDAMMAIPDALSGLVAADIASSTPAAILAWIGASPHIGDDLFDGNCGRCLHRRAGFCEVQKRTVTALDSCEHFDPVRAA